MGEIEWQISIFNRLTNNSNHKFGESLAMEVEMILEKD